MQRLADPHRALAAVVAAQLKVQAFAEADFQRHVDGMGPAGQALLGLRADEQEAHLAIVDLLFTAFPGEVAHQTVERRGLAPVLGEEGDGVACQVAEPRPAHRHATAH
ncbi:hypothetical protein D3C78_1052000 [compost metagenome]